eukprot:EG_transcript_9549
MASSLGSRFLAISTPALSGRTDAPRDPVPFQAADLLMGEALDVQRAVVALPADEGPAQGSVVDDPSKAALRLIKETFTPFVIVNAQSTRFVVHTKYGEGLSSVVYQVEDRTEDMFFALKVVPLCEPFTEETLGTANLLRRLRHKHIVPCHDHFRFVTKGVPFLCLKLPFCPRGSLGDLVRWKNNSGGKISAANISGYVSQLAAALQFLHEQGLLHGDLRPDHVLLYTHQEEVRLIGLTDSIGLRRRSGGPATLTGGRGLYAPPEWAESPFLGRRLHPTEVPLPSYDMWALGCLLVELCTGKLLEDRLGLHGTPLSLNPSAMEAVRLQMQSVHRGAFEPLSRALLEADPETRLTPQGVQEVLRVTNPVKVSSWSGALAKPFKLLRLSHHA